MEQRKEQRGNRKGKGSLGGLEGEREGGGKTEERKRTREICVYEYVCVCVCIRCVPDNTIPPFYKDWVHGRSATLTHQSPLLIPWMRSSCGPDWPHAASHLKNSPSKRIGVFTQMTRRQIFDARQRTD